MVYSTSYRNWLRNYKKTIEDLLVAWALYEVRASYGLYNDYGKTYSWGMRLSLLYVFFVWKLWSSTSLFLLHIKMVLTLNHVIHNHSLLPSSRTIVGFVLKSRPWNSLWTCKPNASYASRAFLLIELLGVTMGRMNGVNCVALVLSQWEQFIHACGIEQAPSLLLSTNLKMSVLKQHPNPWHLISTKPWLFHHWFLNDNPTY